MWGAFVQRFVVLWGGGCNGGAAMMTALFPEGARASHMAAVGTFQVAHTARHEDSRLIAPHALIRQARGLGFRYAARQRPSRSQRQGRYTPESMRHKMPPVIAAQVIQAFTACGVWWSLMPARLPGMRPEGAVGEALSGSAPIVRCPRTFVGSGDTPGDVPAAGAAGPHSHAT